MTLPRKQRKVWDSVATTQGKLSSGLNAQLYAPQSATSLQLTLEHEKLKEARTAYIHRARDDRPERRDVVGYVVAINGKMSSANLYPSNGLFRKMWSKQLAATVTEAIGETSKAAAPEAPKPGAVSEFLAAAERGQSRNAPRQPACGSRRVMRHTLYNEARPGRRQVGAPQLPGQVAFHRHPGTRLPSAVLRVMAYPGSSLECDAANSGLDPG
jgi:hypothetical protein